MGHSFLLKAFDAVTDAWVTKFSLFAITLLRRGTRPEAVLQRNRDIFISLMLLLSIAAVVWFQIAGLEFDLLRRAIAGFAIYRAFDLLISWSRTGLTLNFRGDVMLTHEPVWRVQRTLIGVMFNYVELTMWFTIIYRQLSLTSACQFSGIIEVDQAFNLSFSTMTTIGYGKYAPDGFVSNGLTFFQALISIILLVLVVASVLAMIIDRSKIPSAVATAPSVTTVPSQPQVTSINPANGAEIGSDTVVLVGSGFLGAAAVDFGGALATSFCVDSDQQITVKSPPCSPGTVDVVVTTPEGRSIPTSANKFTYIAATALPAWHAPLLRRLPFLLPVICFVLIWRVLFWLSGIHFCKEVGVTPMQASPEIQRIETKVESLRQEVASDREVHQQMTELIARTGKELDSMESQLTNLQTLVKALTTDNPKGNRKATSPH